VDRVVYGAVDPKLGWTTRFEALQDRAAGFNHRLETTGGVLGTEATQLLKEFFAERRDPPGAVDRVQSPRS
jgi:tRNA(adenine34) deaminase